MGRNGPPFDKGKPIRDKGTTLRGGFDGLDVALGIKREEESLDGSGGVSDVKPQVSKGKKGFSTDDTKGGVREVFAQSPSLDVLSTDAPPPIAVKRPGGKTSTGKSNRDRAREDRRTPKTPQEPVTPKGLYGGLGDRSAEMQADIDNEALIKGVSSFDELYVAINKVGSFQGSRFTYSADAIREIVDSVRSGASSSTEITRAYGLREVAERLLQAESQTKEEAKDAVEAEKDAITLAPDATHGETVTALADGVKKHEVLARLNQQKEQREGSEGKFLAANPELRERAGAAKEAYFTALRAYQRSRSLADAGSERLGFKKANENEGPANLQALKRGWLEARMDVAKARLEAVVQAREDRGVANPNRTKLSSDAVLARFQRRYVIRDAVMGATAEETKMRAEALSSRDRNLVEWTFKAYDALPEGVKDFVTQVGLGAGVVGVSAGAAGLVAAGGIGAIAMAPILAGAAIGLKWRADALGLKKKADKGEAAGRPSEEVQRLRAAQQALQARAQFTTFSGVMGWLTGKATKGLQKETRTKAEADFTLRDAAGNVGATGVGDLRNTDADAFEILARSVDRAYASTTQADALVATTTTVGSLVGGAALGSIYGAGVHGVDSMFNHDTPVVATAEHPPATPAVSGGSEHPPAAVTGGAEAAPAAPAAPPEVVSSAHPTEPEGLLVGATIHRPGEGFGEMIQEFKHNFHEQLSVIDKPAPALAHVLNSNPNDLTHELLVAKDGTSLTMQPGDQFVADENQNIWFQRVGGEPQLVYENDPTAPEGFIKHEIHGHMQADAVRPEAPTPEVARAVPSEGGATAPEDPSAALNRAQLGGSPIPETLAARTDYADGAGINTLTQPESLDTSGLQFTEHPTEAPVAPASAQPEAPEAPVSTTQPTVAPETAPAAHPAVAPEAVAPAPAPEAAPAPAAVPEQAQVAPTAPETVSTGPHPFASPDAPPLLNENGVDLNKPQVLLNEGRWWAHGTNVDDSYERAVAQSTALARAGEPSNVYFVVPDTDVTGRDTLSVRMVFTPPDGSNAQLAPYGEGLSTNAQFTMPPLPKDADYKLPPSK